MLFEGGGGFINGGRDCCFAHGLGKQGPTQKHFPGVCNDFATACLFHLLAGQCQLISKLRNVPGHAVVIPQIPALPHDKGLGFRVDYPLWDI